MPRPSRDHRSAYQRRNARARALGYKSYYDYRVHEHGKLPPAAPAPIGRRRAELRGHRSRKDFLRELGEGDLIVMPEGLRSVERDKRGRYRLIHKLVIDASSGVERNYFLRNLTREQLVHTIEEEERRGAIFSPFPSLDQRRLVRADELDDIGVEGGY